jgi:hypothetical protein
MGSLWGYYGVTLGRGEWGEGSRKKGVWRREKKEEEE